MQTDPFELLARECPEVVASLGATVEALRSLPGPDEKTKHLLIIAADTAVRGLRAVAYHARLARECGASREEVVTAVVVNLHLAGLGAVLDALPVALDGFAAAGPPSGVEV